IPSARPGDVIVGATTLAILIVWRTSHRRGPGPLIALALGAVLAYALTKLVGWDIATIGSRFSYVTDGATHPGIPALPPVPVLPWTFPGADGRPLVLSFDVFRSLVGPAFAIAMLGAIESLLCAVVADGMSGSKHDTDVEIIAQGLGNLVAPFFGGVAASGAIARSATNIRAGSRSPLAAFFHSAFVLLGVLVLAPALGLLPMASLAALLLIVAWNMSEVKHFGHIVRVAPRSDTIVLLTCFTLTVVFDMVVSVTAGVMLAALLFMRRMADISRAKMVEDHTEHLDEALPRGVLMYEIAGPLFFGAAQKAMSAFTSVNAPARVIIIYMGAVPAMDMTGLVALESVLAALHKTRHLVILAGVQEQPAGVLAKAGIRDEEGKLVICRTLEDAVAVAKQRRRPTAEWSLTDIRL